MSTDTNLPTAAAEAQESYVVTEGKKRGSTREVRTDAAYDRWYTVLRVHAGDAILTDNWHTRSAKPRARQLRRRHLRDAHAGGLGRDV